MALLWVVYTATLRQQLLKTVQRKLEVSSLGCFSRAMRSDICLRQLSRAALSIQRLMVGVHCTGSERVCPYSLLHSVSVGPMIDVCSCEVVF
jgi:hypothetical protein